MQLGNTGNTWIYSWYGNPNGVDVQSLNPPLGTLLIDIQSGLLYRKTTDFFDNTNAYVVLSDSGSSVLVVATAPATFTDFSVFPGGIAPSSGVYEAYTTTKRWSYVGGDTQWRYSDLISA